MDRAPEVRDHAPERSLREPSHRVDPQALVAVPKGKLVETLEVLASAVSAGELDEAISKVAPTGVGKERAKKRAA